MKILQLENLLPHLNGYDRDIDSWCDEFTRIMSLANITNPMSMHSWAMECVEEKLRGIQDLYIIEDGFHNYPTIQEIKDAIEKVLEITPQEKCKRLQKLRIQKGESIKYFNWRYKKMYNNLPKFY